MQSVNEVSVSHIFVQIPFKNVTRCTTVAINVGTMIDANAATTLLEKRPEKISRL